jgi:hypothetical protein
MRREWGGGEAAQVINYLELAVVISNFLSLVLPLFLHLTQPDRLHSYELWKPVYLSMIALL